MSGSLTSHPFVGRVDCTFGDELFALLPVLVYCTIEGLSLMIPCSIANPADDATWQKMSSIKSSILARMDTAPSGVRICCIKFVQKVVLVQTPGLIADPRVREHVIVLFPFVDRSLASRPERNLSCAGSARSSYHTTL